MSEKNSQLPSEDSPAVREFEDIIRAAAAANSGAIKSEYDSSPVYVSYDTEDPAKLELAQLLGKVFAISKIQDEFLKINEPNANFRSMVIKIYKWQRADGKRYINVTHNPEGIDLPFDIGLQINENHPWFEQFQNLPDDFQGIILITNDDHGLIASVSVEQ